MPNILELKQSAVHALQKKQSVALNLQLYSVLHGVVTHLQAGKSFASYAHQHRSLILSHIQSKLDYKSAYPILNQVISYAAERMGLNVPIHVAHLLWPALKEEVKQINLFIAALSNLPACAENAQPKNNTKHVLNLLGSITRFDPKAIIHIQYTNLGDEQNKEESRWQWLCVATRMGVSSVVSDHMKKTPLTAHQKAILLREACEWGQATCFRLILAASPSPEQFIDYPNQDKHYKLSDYHHIAMLRMDEQTQDQLWFMLNDTERPKQFKKALAYLHHIAETGTTNFPMQHIRDRCIQLFNHLSPTSILNSLHQERNHERKKHIKLSWTILLKQAHRMKEDAACTALPDFRSKFSALLKSIALAAAEEENTAGLDEILALAEQTGIKRQILEDLQKKLIQNMRLSIDNAWPTTNEMIDWCKTHLIDHDGLLGDYETLFSINSSLNFFSRVWHWFKTNYDRKTLSSFLISAEYTENTLIEKFNYLTHQEKTAELYYRWTFRSLQIQKNNNLLAKIFQDAGNFLLDSFHYFALILTFIMGFGFLYFFLGKLTRRPPTSFFGMEVMVGDQLNWFNFWLYPLMLIGLMCGVVSWAAFTVITFTLLSIALLPFFGIQNLYHQLSIFFKHRTFNTDNYSLLTAWYHVPLIEPNQIAPYISAKNITALFLQEQFKLEGSINPRLFIEIIQARIKYLESKRTRQLVWTILSAYLFGLPLIFTIPNYRKLKTEIIQEVALLNQYLNFFESGAHAPDERLKSVTYTFPEQLNQCPRHDYVTQSNIIAEYVNNWLIPKKATAKHVMQELGGTVSEKISENFLSSEFSLMDSLYTEAEADAFLPHGEILAAMPQIEA